MPMAEKKKKTHRLRKKTANKGNAYHRETFLLLEPRITAIATGCDVLHFLINNSDAPNREDQICWVVDRIRDNLSELRDT